MAIGWRGRRGDAAEREALQRWAQTAGEVDQRYQALASLPFDEAVDTAWRMTPGGLTREEVAARLQAYREGRSF